MRQLEPWLREVEASFNESVHAPCRSLPVLATPSRYPGLADVSCRLSCHATASLVASTKC